MDTILATWQPAARVFLHQSLSDYCKYFSSRIFFAYLKDQDETDPLVVFHVFPLMGVGRGQHAWVGDVDANALPKGAGNCPRGMDPTVGI